MGRPLSIRADRLAKRYRLGVPRGGYDTLRDTLSGFFRTRTGPGPRPSVWALRDVSFEVAAGDVLGIIGRNGAGKSTLLKILSRITEPTEGRVELHGRVGSLLEVGTGFHPELTGAENIYLNGAILGMRRREIESKFDHIVSFAEVESFLETPVKHYSTGMYVRLAFAVAAHLEPEILLVDEVLAVGDAAFQRKCLGKMRSVAHEGRTVLLVSHNLGAISELCNTALLLHEGRIRAHGAVPDVVDAYARLGGNGAQPTLAFAEVDVPCVVRKLRLLRTDGQESTSFDIGEEIVVAIEYQVRSRLREHQFALTLSRNFVEVVHSFDTDRLPETPVREPGDYETRYRIPPMFLKAGVYTVNLLHGTPNQLFQRLDTAAQFDVEERSINTQNKGFRKDRPGHIIAPGAWENRRVAR